MRCSTVLSNVAGSTPLLGTPWGAVRIAKHLHKCYTLYEIRNEEGNCKHGYKHHLCKIAQGVLELFPLIGPLLFWTGRLSFLAGKKIYQCCCKNNNPTVEKTDFVGKERLVQTPAETPIATTATTATTNEIKNFGLGALALIVQNFKNPEQRGKIQSIVEGLGEEFTPQKFAEELNKHSPIIYISGSLSEFVEEIKDIIGAKCSCDDFESRIEQFTQALECEVAFLDPLVRFTPPNDLKLAFGLNKEIHHVKKLGLPSNDFDFKSYEVYAALKDFDDVYRQVIKDLQRATNLINQCEGEKNPSLFARNEGVSAAVKIMYQIQYENKSFEEAYDIIQNSPCKVPGYLLHIMKCFDIGSRYVNEQKDIEIGKYLIEILLSDIPNYERYEHKLKELCKNDACKGALEKHYKMICLRYEENMRALENVNSQRNQKAAQTYRDCKGFFDSELFPV